LVYWYGSPCSILCSINGATPDLLVCCWLYSTNAPCVSSLTLHMTRCRLGFKYALQTCFAALLLQESAACCLANCRSSKDFAVHTVCSPLFPMSLGILEQWRAVLHTSQSFSITVAPGWSNHEIKDVVCSSSPLAVVHLTTARAAVFCELGGGVLAAGGMKRGFTRLGACLLWPKVVRAGAVCFVPGLSPFS